MTKNLINPHKFFIFIIFEIIYKNYLKNLFEFLLKNYLFIK